ncbi:MAG: hypothetical protein JSS60_04790 [Verrucomicrobia bacterium]|nr:hypothetical protein [Verrucomicrobiota bacterium]
MPSISSLLSSVGSPFQTSSLSSADPVRTGSSLPTDSVGAAEETAGDWRPERPLLTAPGDLPPPRLPLSDYRLLAATDETRSLGNQIMDSLSLRLTGVKEKIREVSAENIKKLKESAERASASNFWSILKKVATCLLSAVSIVFGIALVASGGGALIGGAMIASGILSLANFAMSELGTWDWVADQIAHNNEDLKSKLKMILPAAVGIVAGGIGLVGSVNGIVTGALQFAEKAIFIAQTAVTIFDGVTTLGKGIADARLIWTKADLKLIEADLAIQREQFTTTMEEIKGSMNEFKAAKAKAKKAIEMISQTNLQLVRQA